ncbi:MAG: DUF4488 domain-containing protein [Proteiniphilum sp.]|jgi:hypothetical protein|nr:DUF4488 domain-containing protein [Proteiniphilum sp.]
MKTKVFLSLMTLGMILCSSFPQKSAIEGAWRLVKVEDRMSDVPFWEQDTGSGVKFWADGCFAFAGFFQKDSVVFDNYGWGTYKISEGNHYQEYILENHLLPKAKEKTINMLIEIKNDTLIQSWPADENWNLQQKYVTEKYVRLK